MKYARLGSSGLEVSKVCLGTMTWGEQNTQEDANQQLDYAIEKGINFIDTAEIYSVPPKQETQPKRDKKKFCEMVISTAISTNIPSYCSNSPSKVSGKVTTAGLGRVLPDELIAKLLTLVSSVKLKNSVTSAVIDI